VPEVLDDASQLPLGSHGLSLYSSLDEAAEHAASFLAGAPKGQKAIFWVANSALLPYYEAKVAEKTPSHLGCVVVLDTEQVHEVDGRLRPVEPVMNFIGAHPEGVTAAGGTISHYWGPDDLDDHLEYEGWFDEQPRDGSRFLCPYDLRSLPPDRAPEALRSLGRHHSHIVLSPSREPAARLLQLFLFETPDALPPELMETFRWAVSKGFISSAGPGFPLALTSAGDDVVREWSAHAVVG
jgi:hypothetical protein